MHANGALPQETGVYPTHGFGSFCSATQAEADADDDPALVVTFERITHARLERDRPAER